MKVASRSDQCTRMTRSGQGGQELAANPDGDRLGDLPCSQRFSAHRHNITTKPLPAVPVSTVAPSQAKRPSQSAWEIVSILLYMAALLAPNALLFAQSRSLISTLFLLFAMLVVGAWQIAFAWSRWAVALMLPAIVLLPFELYYLWNHRELAGLYVLAIVLETPQDQVRDYLLARLLPLSLGLALAFGIWLTALASNPVRLDRTRARRLVRATAALVLVGAAFALFWSPFAPAAGALGAAVSAEAGSPFALLRSGIGTILRNTFPIGRVHTVATYYGELAQMKAAAAQRRATRTGARQSPLPEPGTRKVVVLVIGESANPRRWSLYGYGRDTTPELSQRGDLIVLRDMVSAWPSTLQAVPIMLTRKSASDPRLYTAEASLINVMREAGFETHWLSTQGSRGNFDLSIAELAADAEFRHFVAGATALKEGQPGDDRQLLPLLADALARPAANLFVVLHTQGSHAPYWERYPKDFERFTPALRAYESMGWRRDQAYTDALSNSYDNSVLYTDHVLAAMLRTIEQSGRQASLFYAADHGELLPDEQCGQMGHGFSVIGNFRIPAFMWLSGDHPARGDNAALAQLRRNSALRSSSSSIFPTVTALAGVAVPGTDATLDLSSPAFREAKRIVNIPVAVDFDRAQVQGKCEWIVQ